MSKRIITSNDTALSAETEEVYTIIAASDGHDYIVEIVEGTKVWNIYNHNITSEEELYYKTVPITIEDTTSIDVSNPLMKIVVKKKDSSKVDEQSPNTSVMSVIPKKKIVFKTNTSISADINSNTNANTNAKNVVVEEKEKKLSPYHAFIKNFLAKHSEIVWNERMKAANAAWKASKQSL